MIDLLVKTHSEAEAKLYNALRDYHDAVVSTISEGSCYVLSRELTVIVNPSCADDEMLIETIKYLEKRTGIKFKSVVQNSLSFTTREA